jgi:hypothetical protein
LKALEISFIIKLIVVASQRHFRRHWRHIAAEEAEMAGAVLKMQCVGRTGVRTRELLVDNLVIAGWTGRDRKAMEAHIEELAKLGVPRPATTPIFYRVGASLLTTSTAIEVSGTATSGEVEPVIFALGDGMWVGLGSDHTDRKAETAGITIAKQLCPKPVAPVLWRFADVAPHWDQILLRSRIVVGGKREPYQEGTAAIMQRPEALIAKYRGGKSGGLAVRTAMFCGTMAVHGGIRPADRFEIVMADPVLKRAIRHSYAIRTLPVAG